MSFKSMLDDDRLNVFVNVDFFGEMYRIEGKEIPIVIDTDELKERQNGQDLAVAEASTLFYARVEDLPRRRGVGESLNVNGRECTVDDWKEDEGIVTVALRENIIA